MSEELTNLIKQVIDKGMELYSLNNHEKAKELFSTILQVDPENLIAQQFIGMIYHKLQKYDVALETFNKLLEEYPDNINVINNIALVHLDTSNADLAIQYLKKCAKLDPDSIMIKTNLGLAYNAKGWYKRAIQQFIKIYEINKSANALVSISHSHCCLGDLEKARYFSTLALELDNDNAQAHFNNAIFLGLQEKWPECFSEMEWRWKMKSRFDSIPEKPKWQGEKLLGKRILVYSEQASGDLIQFVRYISRLKELGAYIILECSSDLHSLLAQFADEIRNRESRKLDFDYSVSAMSLPYFCGIFPVKQNYISPAKSNLDWNLYADVLKVGVIWAGSPYHPNDYNRSFDCKLLKNLCNIPGVKLFSLQKDIRKRFWKGKGEIDLCQGDSDMHMIDMREYMHDFADSASIIKEMDIVISVDTAIAHVAGAMGKTTWLLLPYMPDWRWGFISDKTIWYDSFRLFRQNKVGGWKSVIKRIEKELLCISKYKSTQSSDYVDLYTCLY